MGLTSSSPFKAPTSIPDFVAIFEARLTKLNKEHEYETDDVGFFDIDNLPEISKKTSKGELLRFINAAKNGETIFD